MTKIQMIEENIFAYYQGIARLLGGQFFEEEQVAWFTTGRQSLFRFNGVVRTITRPEKLHEFVDPILEVFLSQKLPFFWVDWQDAGTPGLGAYLRSKKIPFLHLEAIPAMACTLSPLPNLSLPKEVEIISVQTKQDRIDWLNVMMQGFEEPESSRPDIQEFLVNSLTEPQPVFEHFIARWQGESCATATLLYTNQTGGIYNVTTLPAFRRRGLGATITHFTMKMACKAGYSEALLFATPSGFPVYLRLGFKTISTADLFVWNGSA